MSERRKKKGGDEEAVTTIKKPELGAEFRDQTHLDDRSVSLDDEEVQEKAEMERIRRAAELKQSFDQFC
jgi:hypothetical protein